MFGKINPQNIPTKKISFRDLLIVVGFFSLSYGLYQFKPWISYTVCGFLVLIAGFYMKEN